MHVIEINKLYVGKKIKKQNCIEKTEHDRVVRSKNGYKSAML